MVDPFSDERPIKRKTMHEVGQDLSPLSIDELEERINALKAEIDRLEVEKSRKRAVKTAASDLFNLR